MSERLLELRFPADARELHGVRKVVEQLVASVGGEPDCARDAMMAVDEACQNIIRHAYGGAKGDIVLEVDRDGQELVFSLMDFAPPVDPATIRPRDLDEIRPGGLGTFLIRELMDSAEHLEAPPGCGNLLQMRKRIG